MTVLRMTWRSVRGAPLTSIAAVVLIAVGVGANAAVFAVTYQLLVKPLPYRDASRLAIVSLASPDGGDFGVPLADFEQLRVRLRTTESVAAYTTSEAAFRGSGEPRMIDVAYVTDRFFDVLGVPPLPVGSRRMNRTISPRW